jgi:hypothetical protein
MGKRGNRYNKSVEPVGHVIVPQVPMIITFDEDHVEFVAEHLGQALERAYQVIDLFGDAGYDFDPFEDEGED